MKFVSWLFGRKRDVVANGKVIELMIAQTKLRAAIYRTRKDRDKWMKMYEEMERRWRWAKQQKDKWRKEKNDLRAILDQIQKGSV